MAARLLHLLDAFTHWTGRCIAWLLLAMVLTTAVVVILRYALDEGAIMLQESVMYLHALTFMLGIPFALKENAHVRVDLIYGRLSDRSRAAIDLAGHLLFLVPVALAIFLYSRTYVASAWRILEGSPEVGGLPGVFLLKTLIPVMAVLLLLQGVAEIVRNVTILRGQRD